MNKVIIDRTKWAVPNIDGAGPSMLLNDGGNMCCLGFICKAAGFEETYIEHVGDPETIEREAVEEIPTGDPLFNVLFKYENDGFTNSDAAQTAININDHPSFTLADKERMLTELFDRVGVELEFVGEVVDLFAPKVANDNPLPV